MPPLLYVFCIFGVPPRRRRFVFGLRFITPFTRLYSCTLCRCVRLRWFVSVLSHGFVDLKACCALGPPGIIAFEASATMRGVAKAQGFPEPGWEDEVHQMLATFMAALVLLTACTLLDLSSRKLEQDVALLCGAGGLVLMTARPLPPSFPPLRRL